MTGINKKKGFTIVELLVSMSVLLVVSAVATALFLSAVLEQQRILAKQELSGQINFALEYMSKALRMAGKDLSGSCLGEDNKGSNYILTHYDNNIAKYLGIKFINRSDNDTCHEFFLDNISNPSKPVVKEIKNSEPEVAITSDKILINHFYLAINGNDATNKSSETDNIQPRVTIFLDAEVPNKPGANIKTQTTISKRDLNIR